MMQTKWDQVDLKTKFSHCLNFQDLIGTVEQELMGRGEVVCDIHVNGMRVREEDEKRFALSSLDGVQQLIVSSCKPEELLIETIGSALAYMPRLQVGSERLSDELRHEGLDPLIRSQLEKLFEGFQWLVEVIAQVRNLSKTFGLNLNDQEWNSAEKIFTECVSEILSAFEKRDVSLMADIMEYELNSLLRQWSQIFRNTAESLTQMQIQRDQTFQTLADDK